MYRSDWPKSTERPFLRVFVSVVPSIRLNTYTQSGGPTRFEVCPAKDDNMIGIWDAGSHLLRPRTAGDGTKVKQEAKLGHHKGIEERGKRETGVATHVL